MILICDTCGRKVSAPYEIGDMCYELCGGCFREFEDDRDEDQDAHADWLIDPDMGDQ